MFQQQGLRHQLATSIQSTGIDKYDGKSNPEQFLRVYSTAVHAVGGNADTMVSYFLVMLDSTLIPWLEGLKEDSIDN